MRAAFAVLLPWLLAIPAAAAEPLTLEEALAIATRGNADLDVARAARDAASVDLYQSYSGILPRLDLAGGFGRRFLSGQESVNVVPILIRDSTGAVADIGFAQKLISIPATGFGDYQLALTLKWTLFDGLAAWNRILSARATARSADRSLDESTLGTLFEVTRRFLEVLKQERILAVRQETAARSQELVRRADALFAAGRGSKGDTYAARVNFGNDRIAVEAQRAQVVRARADLSAALGRDADPDLSVAAPPDLGGPGPPPLDEPPPMDVLLSRARKARPLLAAREESVAAAEHEVSRSRGGFWPVLGVEGTYQRQSTELVGSSGVFGDPTRQYLALARLTLTWNLFQGRETLAAEQRAGVQARRARAEAAQAEQQVSVEIARARSSVVALARTVSLAQDNLTAAEQGLALARDRLDAGAASQLEVRDATLKLAEAKLALVSGLVDHAVARADLKRALGGAL